jgi:hypothetical protein
MARKNKLLRYELEQSISCGKPVGHFKIRKEGQWVYWNDVAPYIKDGLRTSTNNARVKCPSCGNDIKITVTSPVA